MRGQRLSVPLVLETSAPQPDGMGGHAVAWRAVGLVYGQMKPGAGGLRGGGAGVASEVRWTITLRAFPPGDPRRPVAGQRLRIGQRVFLIEAVAETGAAARFLRITAEEARA